MARSVTVLTVKGIPVRLHLTFLLVLPLFAYLMARAYFTPPQQAWPDNAAWVWGTLLAVGLFASVLLHEFAHSFMAMHEGVHVRHITLLPIGGVSAFDEIPREPGKELRITLVGPLTNFVIGLPLLAIVLTGLVPEVAPGLRRFLLSLAGVNLALGVFNLFLPAFPMDGGRILRAALATRMPRARATRIASVVGQGLALLMGAFGLLTLGNGGWLMLLIAVFIFTGARAEEGATRVTEALDHYRVRDLMTPDVDVVPPTLSVEEALERMVRTKHLVLPVMDDEGRIHGVAHVEELRQVPDTSRHMTTIATLVRPEYDTAAPDEPASELGRLLTRGASPVLVLRKGALVGIVTASDVARFTHLVTAVRPRQPRAGPL